MEHAYTLGVWIMQVYVSYEFEPDDYVKPEKQLLDISKLTSENKELEIRIAKLTDEYKKISKEYDKQVAIKRLKKAKILSKKIELSEAETRDLIDEQLRKAGWEADTVNIRYSIGVRPEKGKNLAIAEWPTKTTIPDSSGRGVGHVDYALFIGTQLVGFVEAKKFKKDIPAFIDGQCKDYSIAVRNEDMGYLLNPNVIFKVPFLFATNGRKFYKEMPNQSGVWFLDTRVVTNISAPLKTFLSPSDIRERLDKDINVAITKLTSDQDKYLVDKNGLNLRYYQYDAVKAVEEAVLNNSSQILLSMATGTGKTRVALAIIYKLLRASRFNRVLFLVDRTSLGEQAEDKFNEVHLEDLQNLNELHGVRSLETPELDMDKQIHVVTVQSLVRKLLYNEGTENVVNMTPGNYDLIIVDEAHRGYTLEQEMDEDDILYRNQLDFQSKYRQVIEFFDAVKIGLTATPALHTTVIFGKPIFNYTYRQGVIDGYLVDHEPPYIINTEFNTNGIKYTKGETLAIVDSITGEITNSEELDDEVNFDVDKFNKKVITPKFNKTVLNEIAKYIDPEGDEKTLIFAVNDTHADEIVSTLREIYHKMGGVNHQCIRKITGKSYDNQKKVLELVKKYKVDYFPTIAVTVDLLTTGIDVPTITNLVFMRRVKSRILFEQMLGRATRLCPDIKKTHFNIFDAVRVYESLELVTNMKPVTTKGSMSMEGLIDELDVVTEEKVKVNIDQIIAKVHRKKNLLSDEDRDRLQILNDGKSIEDIINDISTDNEKANKVRGYKDTLIFLEGLKDEKRGLKIFSDKDDTFTGIDRGYGDTTKPEDYLESFANFIATNKNLVPALNLVCTKPTNLTRKDLKELKIMLEDSGFTETNLQVAYKNVKDVDVIADIISYIRNVALDVPVVSHELRIKRAIDKVKRNHADFNKRQINFLDKIGRTLQKETVLDMEMLNVGAFKIIELERVFDNKVKDIVGEINSYLYGGEINEYIRNSV